MSANNVEQIKERLSIEEIVGQYVKLTPAGQNLKARCPFHSERTPSFVVSPARQTYHCFGCGVGGDIFTFVEEMEGLDFKGALKVLADRAGVTLTYDSGARSDERDTLFAIVETAAQFYVGELGKNPEAKKYLAKRGLTEKTLETFRIGFAPGPPAGGWDAVLAHLKGKGYEKKDITAAGLAIEGTKGPYDRFRSRIMFPIADSAGRVVAFSGRHFSNAQKSADTTPAHAEHAGGQKDADTDDKEPAKYINSPDTPLYHKSKLLYGYDHAKQSIRRNNFCILVEGQMDLVSVHQAGFSNTVALSGTALTPEQIVLISRMSKNLIIALDADEAGLKSAGKSARAALRSGFDVKVAALPEGADPDDVIRKQGVDAWKKIIKHSTHIIDFLLAFHKTHAADARMFKLRVTREVLPYLHDVESEIDRTHFIQRIALVLGVSEDAVRNDLRRVTALPTDETSAAASPHGKSEGGETSFGLEEQLIGIYLWQSSVKAPAVDVVSLKEGIVSALGEAGFATLAEKVVHTDEKTFRFESLFADSNTVQSAVDDLLARLKAVMLAKKLDEATGRLRQAEAEGKEGEISASLAACDKIRGEIADL
ncbi:MAG: CHC2 zinc finger domain-containing protein [bacterium]|nr:CHC2 zinc finger domain-containing protein [bacterium]